MLIKQQLQIIFLQLFIQSKQLKNSQSQSMQQFDQNIKVENDNNYYYEHNTLTNGPFIIQKNTSQIYSSFIKSGHWAQKEKLRYGLFLIYFRQLLQKKQNRRLLRLFKSMSEFVKTRNPNQCRSHHQKMEKYFGSVTNIIDYFNDKYQDIEQRLSQNKEILEDIYLKFKNKLEDEHAEENQPQNRFTKDQFLSLFQIPNNIIENKQLSQEIDEKDKELVPTGLEYYPTEQPKQHTSNFMEKILKKSKQDMVPAYQNPYLKNFSADTNPYLSNLAGKNPYINSLASMNPYLNNSLQMDGKNSQLGFEIEGTGQQRNRQKQWRQCHQYFIQWITRLNKLVNSPQKSYNY